VSEFSRRGGTIAVSTGRLQSRNHPNFSELAGRTAWLSCDHCSSSSSTVAHGIPVASTSETRGRTRIANPRLRRTRSMRARPVRHLPSAKGWILSTCACAIAAWAIAGKGSVRQNAHRSSMRSATSSGGGGAKVAAQGLYELPPIQLCWSRSLPANRLRRTPARSFPLRTGPISRRSVHRSNSISFSRRRPLP
jgi:hypothetical protein